jgi:hypothetical protein
MTASRDYCPACLDLWCTQSSRIPLGSSLHVSCGRALLAILVLPPEEECDD